MCGYLIQIKNNNVDQQSMIEEAKNEQFWILNHVIINSRLYSITASTWNQYQQMLTPANQTSCERQAKNPLAQSCPLLTWMMR